MFRFSVMKRPRYHSERSQLKGAVATEATIGAGATQRQAKNEKAGNDADGADRAGGDPVQSSSPSSGPRVMALPSGQGDTGKGRELCRAWG